MPSSDQLALPTGWSPRQRFRGGAVRAVAPLLGVLVALSGLRGLTGEYPAASGGLLCLAGLLALGGRMFRPRPAGRPPVFDKARAALRFDFSRQSLAVELAAIVLFAGTCGLFAVAAAQERLWVVTVLCGLVAVGFAGLLGHRLFRGLHVGELLLTPTTVALCGTSMDDSEAWDDITVFPFERVGRGGVVLGRDLGLLTYPKRPWRWYRTAVADIRIPLHRMEVDEVALYHLLEFYRRHPDARAELAGPAAIARWEARDYPEG